MAVHQPGPAVKHVAAVPMPSPTSAGELLASGTGAEAGTGGTEPKMARLAEKRSEKERRGF